MSDFGNIAMKFLAGWLGLVFFGYTMLAIVWCVEQAVEFWRKIRGRGKPQADPSGTANGRAAG